jgi:hypothetical protein
MDRLIDNKSDLKKSLEEYFKRVEAIQKLPEYAEFLKYREECEQFAEFINNKRIEKTYEFIQSIIKDDMKVKDWLERIKNLEKELSDSAWKRHESFCSSNIMDHIWEVVKKYGHPVEAEDMFDQEAFVIGKYTMAVYSGQGEYGYSISVKNRIF